MLWGGIRRQIYPMLGFYIQIESFDIAMKCIYSFKIVFCNMHIFFYFAMPAELFQSKQILSNIQFIVTQVKMNNNII